MATITEPELPLADDSENDNSKEATSFLPRMLTAEQAVCLLQRLAEPPRPLTPAMQRAILTYHRYMTRQNGD